MIEITAPVDSDGQSKEEVVPRKAALMLES